MQIIGHRGARGLAPENTVAAFKKGLSCKVDAIELDVRITKDGFVVLHHDPFVSDSNGSQLIIIDTDFAELQRIKSDLATLDEAFVAINRVVPMYIEIKPAVSTAPIITITKKYRELGWSDTDILFCSFSFPILKIMHAAFPSLELIVLEPWSGVRASYRARKLHTTRISMNHKWLWWMFIASVNRSGFKLATYTLNDPRKAARWKKYGLYAVITDFPDRFQEMNEV